MPVLVEGISPIIRVQAIHDRYAGGWTAFDDSVPNNTLCSDNEVARVGFMTPQDCEAFVGQLERHGLTFLRDGQCQDIAVAVQDSGLTAPCDWLEVGRIALTPGQTVTTAWLKGTTIENVFCPPNWTYEKSLSRQYAVAPVENDETSLKFLRHQDGLDVYLDLSTGQEVFVGRPDVGSK
jgi:hypothetical protein